MPSEPDLRALEALEARLGHRFARPELLVRALTHDSRANEDGEVGESNERLEWLGDAALGLAVSELLHDAAPAAQEGELSRARACAVSQATLARFAQVLDLASYVLLGRGERLSGGSEKPRVLASACEAVLGALFLDGGYPAVRALIAREHGVELDAALHDDVDAKTRLQERLQVGGGAPPLYSMLAKTGPAHAPRFRVEVRSGERALATGEGDSKRAAEQQAARSALAALEASS